MGRGAHWSPRPARRRSSARRDTGAANRLPLARRAPVPLELGGHALVTLDSGERHSHATSGYNQRREECARACSCSASRRSRSDARDGRSSPVRSIAARATCHQREPPRRGTAADALERGDLEASRSAARRVPCELARLYEVSTPAVEHAVSGCTMPARSARGSWAGGLAVTCSRCCRPTPRNRTTPSRSGRTAEPGCWKGQRAGRADGLRGDGGRCAGGRSSRRGGRPDRGGPRGDGAQRRGGGDAERRRGAGLRCLHRLRVAGNRPDRGGPARGASASAGPLARRRDGAAGRARSGAGDDAAASAVAGDGVLGRAARWSQSRSWRC